MSGVVSMIMLVAFGRGMREHDETSTPVVVKLRFNGSDDWEIGASCGCTVQRSGWLRCWNHRGAAVLWSQLSLPFDSSSWPILAERQDKLGQQEV